MEKRILMAFFETLLKDQESCLLNGGKTSCYYKLEGGTQQGDPVLAYIIIMVLEIVFTLIKTNSNIEGLNIFNHNSLMIQLLLWKK